MVVTTLDGVIASTTIEEVIFAFARDRIIALATVDRVETFEAGREVVALTKCNSVVFAAALYRVIAIAGADVVVTFAGVDSIVTLTVWILSSSRPPVMKSFRPWYLLHLPK